MTPRLYDAHVHLASPGLLSVSEEIEQCYTEIGLSRAIVVGTNPADWNAVLDLCKGAPRYTPMLGLHPWKVNDAANDWQARLLEALDHGAKGIGEIGLDQWIDGHDIERQQTAFKFQLDVAQQRNLPVSIHCLKAIGPMMDTLREVTLPKRGLHIHAYNGPIELVSELVEMGAFFSFNAGQLKPQKTKVPERIKAIPLDRLLIETDAPDFLPEDAFTEFQLSDVQLCHPGNLRRGYQAIAELRGISFEALAEQVESNFIQYFE